MAQQNVCRYFKFGFCKFAMQCRLMHINQICENPSCDIKACNLRHPRICNYYRDYRRCKFGQWCYFKHENILDNIQSDNLNTIERINAIENLLKEKDVIAEKIQECDRQLKSIEEIMKRFDTFEELINKKDKVIDNLLERVESLEKKISTSKSQLVKESDVEEEIPIEDETLVDDEQFKCSKCDFESFSNKGLKIHMKKKHTNYETLNYPRTCDFCEKIFENGFELRKHMKLHSFKGTLFGEYKCEECDFYGDSLEMMEVHAGKCRNDDFDCGLCHHKFARLEELKTHLASREVYECAEY